MLQVKDIVKVYQTGGEDVTALRGVSLSFRESEFVAVLGHSGCGKTTLLNIIGGLDQYTSGDLIINGRSTKEFTDRDWDYYRNHSIGFVFQSYNLIPHQSVLSNVELALTLSGVSKAERRRRAAEALEKVGLKDQMKKRPNQLSGGQMQRVAIARALVNDPDILLADEPTGALDSETSVQVMDILQEIAQDKLVIMVTHNPELAERYATRIIRVLDGKVVSDSNPYDAAVQPVVQGKSREKKPSMSFATAFSLSLNNLMTKKGRTILTSFAGSIGIIGIALILSLSSGINAYINQVQEDTLSSYPITIEAESVDMSSMITSLMGARHQEEEGEREADRVYASTIMFDMLNSMVDAETTTNNLEAFKAYLDNGGGGIADLATIRYSYDIPFDVYTKDADGKIVKSDVTAMLEEAMTALYGGDYTAYFDTMGGMYQQMNVWEELLPGEDGELVGDQVKGQYDLLYGTWPQADNEVILFVDQNNEISDLMLSALGLISTQEMTDNLNALQNGESVDTQERSWSYEELCNTTFKLILPAQRYQADGQGGYTDLGATDSGLQLLYDSDEAGISLKVVGVARPSEEATASMVTGAIGYTSALTEKAIAATLDTDVVQDQLDDPDTDVITGLPFPEENAQEPTAEEKREAVEEALPGLTVQEKAAAYTAVMSQPEESYVEDTVSAQMEGMTREDIEEMISQQYAGEMGVDAQRLSDYIAGMSDEELFAQVEEAIAQQIRQQYAAGVEAQLGALSQDRLAGMLDAALTGDTFTDDQILYLYDNFMPPTVSDSTYEENLELLGYVDLDSPSSISLYASTFAEKDAIADLIQDYNDGVENEEDTITYTDYVALLMSSITDIISGISYLLIAFVSISLVVSSIMIGIITYISVLERTKEIGILRAVGASKKDVSRVFNAETLIVGLGAGLIGIVVTLLLLIPINAILLHLTGLVGLKAALPPVGAGVLVAISALLTIIAGLIPSRMAARKDPVEALRTE